MSEVEVKVDVKQKLKEDAVKLLKNRAFQVAVGCLALGFALGRSSVDEVVCDEKVICEDCENDKRTLQTTLNKKDKQCLDEKAKLTIKLTETFERDCVDQLNSAVKDCKFSEKIHCPICVARGVCK